MKDEEPVRAQTFFTDAARWQSWLDVEAALALTQADIGMIPAKAGPEIASRARLDALDVERLRAEIARTRAPVFALTTVLAEACGDSGKYVHWGATTQNVIETGRLLVLRRVQAALRSRLSDCLSLLADIAEDHADLAMVGRTNRQNALPITYGFKVAGWIAELLRVSQQLAEVEPRLFELRFGGAIGGYHGFGKQGPEMVRALADRLGLIPALVPNRTSLDPLMEYVGRLALLGVAVERIASELYLLMTEEIGEVREVLPEGVVGSSTMPHKVNPKIVVELAAAAARLRQRGLAVYALPAPSHEGDTITNRQIGQLISESCADALEAGDRLAETLRSVAVMEHAVARNLNHTHTKMATEDLMMRLADRIGRGPSHDLVHHLVDEAEAAGADLAALLRSSSELASHLPTPELDAILEIPNTGFCRQIAEDAANAARKEGERLRLHSERCIG